MPGRQVNARGQEVLNTSRSVVEATEIISSHGRPPLIDEHSLLSHLLQREREDALSEEGRPLTSGGTRRQVLSGENSMTQSPHPLMNSSNLAQQLALDPSFTSLPKSERIRVYNDTLTQLQEEELKFQMECEEQSRRSESVSLPYGSFLPIDYNDSKEYDPDRLMAEMSKGRSLRSQRAAKTMGKRELRIFKEHKKQKLEKKRRDWLQA